jgi:hypothetical protein
MRLPACHLCYRPGPRFLLVLAALWAVGAAVGLAAAPGLCSAAAAGTTSPALRAIDTPGDWGTSLTATWTRVVSPDAVVGYDLWRRTGQSRSVPPSQIAADTAGVISRSLAASGWEKVFSGDPTETTFVDANLDSKTPYVYQLVARTASGEIGSEVTAPQKPRAQVLIRDRINILVAVILFVGVILGLVERARRGAKLFVRKIAGLEAVEEAVGRATEMGRPILYVPGLDPMDEVATVAAIDILGQVAKKAAEYETKIIVPNRDPIVMAVAQQVVRESFSAAGKPQLYREGDIFYVTYSQFGFAAAVAGLMIRERPATNFFIGHFYAESLVLAETGNATGAIQIAGTDADSQLPFFITSCDYTLIGEELYAGAVYLSRQPLLLGALKAQDYAKLVLMAAMLVGIVLSAVNPEVAAVFRGWFK